MNNDVMNFIKNNYFELSIFFGLIIVFFFLGRLLKLLFTKISQKHKLAEKSISAAVINTFSKSITLFLISLGFIVGIALIDFPEQATESLWVVKRIVVTLFLGQFFFYLAEVPSVWFESYMEKSESGLNKLFYPVIKRTMRFLVLVFAFLHIVQILIDKPITTVLAGLGIGGLAVALAAQDTLKHFIGSFVIVGDKPYKIGDRIVIDGYDGNVESVGLRSTQFRTLDGHMVSIPNGEMANKTILNISERPYIKKVMNLTVTYDTSPEKLKKAKQIVEKILENHEGMNPERPPRVYFNDFLDSALNINVIYWYHPADYWAFMDLVEKVNFEILTQFNNEGIEFAFPTQTVHLAKE